MDKKAFCSFVGISVLLALISGGAGYLSGAGASSAGKAIALGRAGLCIDSDGGIDFYLKGICNDNMGNNYSDSCSKDGNVIEAGCINNKCKSRVASMACQIFEECVNGACRNKTSLSWCNDTDPADDPNIKGSCKDSEGDSMSDGCYATRITREVGCVNNFCTSTAPKLCIQGSSCINGICLANCNDECTAGTTRCMDANHSQICGNWDADTCTEWGNTTRCSMGCANNTCNAPFVSECRFMYQTNGVYYNENLAATSNSTCLAQGVQRFKQICSDPEAYNGYLWWIASDSYEDFRDYLDINGDTNGCCCINRTTNYCVRSKYCMQNASSCTNDCSYSGERRCLANSSQVCGNYDADSCLDWQTTSCITTPTCYYNASSNPPGDYRYYGTCIGAGWCSTTSEYCPNGCQNGICTSNSTPSCGGWKCKDEYDLGYQNSDCTWGTGWYCFFGCNQTIGGCNEYCMDTDYGPADQSKYAGMIMYQQGTNSYNLTDTCTSQGRLLEYFCIYNNFTSYGYTYHNCSCVNAACT